MNKRRTAFRNCRPLVCAGLLAVLGGVPGASAQITNGATRPDYFSFRIVSERNIFNASRSGGRGSGSRETRHPMRVDTVALVGTLDSANGVVAFFDGSSPEFRKAFKSPATIAGFKIADIAFNRVRLEAGDTKLELRVGTGLRREDGGEWRVSEFSGAASGGSSSASASFDGQDSKSSSAGGASGADASGVLKRLMEQREKETQ